ncbi:MAG TPA: hypothetical protein VIH93_10825, partial [Thermoanaerobaculia bacterium]
HAPATGTPPWITVPASVVLGDRAETPCFIETIPRRGYRFLLPVQFDCPIRKSPTEKESSPVGLAAGRRAWLLVPTAPGPDWRGDGVDDTDLSAEGPTLGGQADDRRLTRPDDSRRNSAERR